MCVLTSWHILGAWQLWTIHQLLRLPFPVGLAIDVSTYTPDKADTVLLVAVSHLVKGDTKAELMENVHAAERVLVGQLNLRVK